MNDEPALFALEPVSYAIAPATGRHLETFLAGRPRATQEAYRRALTDFFATVRKPAGAIALEDLQAYAAALAVKYHDAAGRPTASVRQRLFAIRRFFRYAAGVGWTSRNVAAELVVPRNLKTVHGRILSHEAVVRALYAPGTPERDRILMRTLYRTGMRVSELCALRVGSLSLHPAGYGTLEILGKGEKVRRVDFPPSLYADLVRVAGGRPHDAPLFTGGHRFRRSAAAPHGKALEVPPNDWPLTRAGVLAIIRRAAKRGGLELRPSPHWFRHSHASHAIWNGADIFAVARTLGHASPSTTMLYAHAKPRDSSAFSLTD